MPTPIPATPAGKMEFNRLTLAFSGGQRHLEPIFAAQYFERHLTHLRLCHLLTILFYAIPGLLDASIFPQVKSQLWAVRYLLVCPVFLAGYAFTYSPRYRRWWQEISAGYIVLTGGGFVWMTAIAAPPLGHGYYVGIIICFMFGYTLIRERFVHASVAGTVVLAAYFAVSLTASKIPVNLLLHNGIHLLIANALGMFIAYYLEFSSRKNFLGYPLD